MPGSDGSHAIACSTYSAAEKRFQFAGPCWCWQASRAALNSSISLRLGTAWPVTALLLDEWLDPVMPRYFFDVKNGHRLIDPAGLDCRNDQEAIERPPLLQARSQRMRQLLKEGMSLF